MTMLREEWLMTGLAALQEQIFKPNKYVIPSDIRVSCGWPSARALSFAQRTIGQCWYPQGNGNHELFISPMIGDSIHALDILSHEVVHTLVGKKAGHKAPFKYVAKRIGLVGPMTSTIAGPALREKLTAIVKELGPYPHKPIQATARLKAAVKTQYLPGECSECGYLVRVAAEWVASLGFPSCPGCGISLDSD